MREHNERRVDKEGFERWCVDRKVEDDSNRKKEGLRSERGNRRSERTFSMPVGQSRSSARKGKRTQVDKEKGSVNDCRRTLEKSTDSGGKFVITEEEYEMLKTLKNQAAAGIRTSSLNAFEVGEGQQPVDRTGIEEASKRTTSRVDSGFSETLNRKGKENSIQNDIPHGIERIHGFEGEVQTLEILLGEDAATGDEDVPKKGESNTLQPCNWGSASNSGSDLRRMGKKHLPQISPGLSPYAFTGTNKRVVDVEGVESRTRPYDVQDTRHSGGRESHEETSDDKVPGLSRGDLVRERQVGGLAFVRNEITENVMRESGKKRFYPFEEGHEMDEEDSIRDSIEQGILQKHGGVQREDENFEEPSLHMLSISEDVNRSALSESEGRADQKRRKTERELFVRKREADGKKPFYIMVSASGTPYGDGMTAWKAELSKLCRSLDPTIRDVRQQPHQKIQLLKKRLTDNFEYSGVISDKYLIPLIGVKVSARRNELMNQIRLGKTCPSGFNPDMWDTLANICGSPNFAKKSAAMKYANSCRQNLGRTGPGGEVSVRDTLKRMLRRSPDPEEVQAEMTRDKGFGGRKRKTEAVVSEEKRLALDWGRGEKCMQTLSEESEDLHLQMPNNNSKSASNQCQSDAGKGKNIEEVQLLKKLEEEIKNLKARMTSNSAEENIACAQTPEQSLTMKS